MLHPWWCDLNTESGRAATRGQLRRRAEGALKGVYAASVQLVGAWKRGGGWQVCVWEGRRPRARDSLGSRAATYEWFRLTLGGAIDNS